MPARQLLRRVLGERPQGEAEIFVDVERAGDVLLVIAPVLRLVVRAIEHAAIDEKLPPLVIAVPGEQRVVQVEEHEAHGAPDSTGGTAARWLALPRSGAARRCARHAGAAARSRRARPIRR